MTKRLVAILMAAGALIVSSGVRIAAHERHDHKIMWTVAAADQLDIARPVQW